DEQVETHPHPRVDLNHAHSLEGPILPSNNRRVEPGRSYLGVKKARQSQCSPPDSATATMPTTRSATALNTLVCWSRFGTFNPSKWASATGMLHAGTSKMASRWVVSKNWCC